MVDIVLAKNEKHIFASMTLKRPLISKEITIRDVAEQAGVSPSLVSVVLNARRTEDGIFLCSANQKTAERILETSQRLGYQRNKAASQLRSGHSNSIGIIVPDISNTCFANICRKLENLADEAGYLAIIGNYDDRERNFRQLVDKFLSSEVDGIIVAPCAGVEDSIKKIQDRNIPVVLFDRDLPEMDNVGRVMLDNEKAGAIAMRILLNKGCRKVCFIRYETDIPTILLREAGCRKAAEESGVDFYVDVLSRETLHSDMVSTIRKAHDEKADGVILPSNTITVEGVSAIHYLDYSMSEDFAVVGFDQENMSGVFDSSVSFVSQPTYLVAEYSFKMLLGAMKDFKMLGTRILEPLYTTGKCVMY